MQIRLLLREQSDLVLHCVPFVFPPQNVAWVSPNLQADDSMIMENQGLKVKGHYDVYVAELQKSAKFCD